MSRIESELAELVADATPEQLRRALQSLPKAMLETIESHAYAISMERCYFEEPLPLLEAV